MLLMPGSAPGGVDASLFPPRAPGLAGPALSVPLEPQRHGPGALAVADKAVVSKCGSGAARTVRLFRPVGDRARGPGHGREEDVTRSGHAAGIRDEPRDGTGGLASQHEGAHPAPPALPMSRLA